MKKILIVLVLPILLAGCSLFDFAKKDTKVTPKPAVKISSDINVGNFYFNAGESGLTLLNTDDDDFSVALSEKEIGEANIIDGVLTFTELLPTGENVRVINLTAYAESLLK